MRKPGIDPDADGAVRNDGALTGSGRLKPGQCELVLVSVLLSNGERPYDVASKR